MPLIAGFTWTETATGVEVHIPLKGTSPKKVDVFATDCVLKVSFPPYLIDLDLYGRIDDYKSKAFVRNGVLILKARKHEESLGIWGEISAEKSEETRVRRQESIAGKTKRVQELSERVKVRKHEDERKALRQQMSVEEAERQRIEDLKSDEKRRAEEDVYRTLAELESRRQPTAAQQNTLQQNILPAPAAAVASAAGIVHGQPAGYDSVGAACVSRKGQKAHSAAGAAEESTADSAYGGMSGAGSAQQQTMGANGDASCAFGGRGEGNRDIWSKEDGSLQSNGGDQSNDGCCCSSSEDNSDHESDTDREEIGISSSFDADAAVVSKTGAAATDDQSTGSNGSSGDGSWVDVKSPAAAAATGDGSGDGGRSKAAAEVDIEVRYTPAPRAACQVTLGFTPRVFPTPLRESKAAEEEAWVIRNRSHLRRRQVPGVGQLDVAESDPAWLKAKGDDFYRAGDLRSAVSAYTAALDAAAELRGESASNAAAAAAASAAGAATADAAAAAVRTACLSNRAACHLRLGELDQCIADCTTALEALGAGSAEVDSAGDRDESGRPVDVAAGDPAEESTPAAALPAAATEVVPAASAAATSITKLLARRGAAYARRGDYSLSAADLGRAATLASQDAALAADREIIERLARCAELKQLADQAVAAAGSHNGDGIGDGKSDRLATACKLYTEALTLVPSFVSCLSNRAACYLAMGQPMLCEEDCSRALDVLQEDDNLSSNGDANIVGQQTAPTHGNLLRGRNVCDLAAGPVPPPGSEKRRQWVLRTLARRGAARLRLEKLDAALRDFEAASALAPQDSNLRADANKLKDMVAAAAAAAAAVSQTVTAAIVGPDSLTEQ